MFPGESGSLKCKPSHWYFRDERRETIAVGWTVTMLTLPWYCFTQQTTSRSHASVHPTYWVHAQGLQGFPCRCRLRLSPVSTDTQHNLQGVHGKLTKNSWDLLHQSLPSIACAPSQSRRSEPATLLTMLYEIAPLVMCTTLGWVIFAITAWSHGKQAS